MQSSSETESRMVLPEARGRKNGEFWFNMSRVFCKMKNVLEMDSSNLPTTM